MKNLVSNSKGQSTVEYILLMALVGMLFSVVVNSNFMQDILSENGGLIQATKAISEFNYRHGRPGVDALGQGENTINYTTVNQGHASYVLGNGTYFFAPAVAYP